jgi:hypothetical protein
MTRPGLGATEAHLYQEAKALPACPVCHASAGYPCRGHVRTGYHGAVRRPHAGRAQQLTAERHRATARRREG